MPDNNIGVFVDIFSLHKNIRTIYGGKLDYRQYLNTIRKQGAIYRAFACGVQKDNEAEKFIDFLEIIGFETNYIPIKLGRDGKIYYTDRSVQLTIEMVRIVDKLDIVVFGTNNPAMIPAIAYARERGCKTVIFACNIPKEIKEVANKWWEITENYLEIKNNGEDIEEEVDEYSETE